jgi:fructokinase
MMLSCGDALIDFVPVMAADGREAVRPAVGGSCLNVAIGLSRLGSPTGFVGGISTDLFGRMIADHALASGVDITPATRSDHQTTLAFVRIVGGESQYAFYDAATAAREWIFSRDSIPFDRVEALHVGSTTLVHDQGAAQTSALIAAVKPRATIAFDPNCRPNLVKDIDAYRARIDAFAEGADIIKMSDVDFNYLYGGDGYAAKAAALLSRGPSLVVVTGGNQGAQAWHRDAGMVEVKAPKVEVVDTIGAGDSFQAALLFALRELGCIERNRLQATASDELRRALSFACECAAVTCTRAGADPPWQREVTALYERLRMADG